MAPGWPGRWRFASGVGAYGWVGIFFVVSAEVGGPAIGRAAERRGLRLDRRGAAGGPAGVRPAARALRIPTRCRGRLRGAGHARQRSHAGVRARHRPGAGDGLARLNRRRPPPSRASCAGRPSPPRPSRPSAPFPSSRPCRRRGVSARSTSSRSTMGAASPRRTSRLDDPRVAAVAIGEAGGDRVEQPPDHLGVGHHAQHLAAGVEVLALGQRDHVLGQPAHRLGLGLGGHDALVAEQATSRLRNIAQRCWVSRPELEAVLAMPHRDVRAPSAVIAARRGQRPRTFGIDAHAERRARGRRARS